MCRSLINDNQLMTIRIDHEAIDVTNYKCLLSFCLTLSPQETKMVWIHVIILSTDVACCILLT